jgi:hypothetical protein
MTHILMGSKDVGQQWLCCSTAKRATILLNFSKQQKGREGVKQIQFSSHTIDMRELMPPDQCCQPDMCYISARTSHSLTLLLARPYLKRNCNTSVSTPMNVTPQPSPPRAAKNGLQNMGHTQQ